MAKGKAADESNAALEIKETATELLPFSEYMGF
jgi:hypothetical protein